MRLRARALATSLAAATLVAGVPVLGVVAPAQAAVGATVGATAAPAAPADQTELAEGDRGALVLRLQRRLGGVPTTGYFGPKTRAAVEAVQEAAGLPVTGVVDDATWAAVRAAAADRAARGQAGPQTSAAAPAASTAPANTDPAAADSGTAGAIDDQDPTTEQMRQQIIAVAASLKGIPYVAGGTKPSTGFDCSGYTSYVYKTAIGMTIPRVSRDQYAFSEHISRSEAKPGDLVFFHNGGYVYHVTIYAGNGMVWHSPHTGDVVRKSPIWTSSVYYGRVL
jgi:peptidoglycan DL-endopeptidase CwlO